MQLFIWRKDKLLNICKINGCEKKVLSRGLCSTHYSRLRRTGDPGGVELLKDRHGMSRTKVYRAWAQMIQRCHNPKSPNYRIYGDRGITVCEEWRAGFMNFFRDMGDLPNPFYCLDRINNNIGYCKENCRWISGLESRRNQRRTKINLEKAKQIHELRKNGFQIVEIAKRFRLAPKTIGNILSGYRWKEAMEVVQ